MTGPSAGAAAISAIDTAYRKLDTNPEAPPVDVPMFQVARLGWASAVLGDVEGAVALATSLAKRALTGKDPRARAWGRLILAHVSLEAALPSGDSGGACRMTQADMGRLCTVLEDLEQCTQELLAVRDVHGLHACCRCAFSLPRLGRSTVQQVDRWFLPWCCAGGRRR